MTIVLPLPTYEEKGKTKLLSMNKYRNLHHFVSNKAKKEYESYIWHSAINGRKKMVSNKISVTYTIFFKDRIRRDLTNFGSIIDKFFLDTLVNHGIIKDDSINYVKEVHFKFGGISEHKCLIEVKDLGK